MRIGDRAPEDANRLAERILPAGARQAAGLGHRGYVELVVPIRHVECIRLAADVEDARIARHPCRRTTPLTQVGDLLLSWMVPLRTTWLCAGSEVWRVVRAVECSSAVVR